MTAHCEEVVSKILLSHSYCLNALLQIGLILGYIAAWAMLKWRDWGVGFKKGCPMPMGCPHMPYMEFSLATLPRMDNFTELNISKF